MITFSLRHGIKGALTLVLAIAWPALAKADETCVQEFLWNSAFHDRYDGDAYDIEGLIAQNDLPISSGNTDGLCTTLSQLKSDELFHLSGLKLYTINVETVEEVRASLTPDLRYAQFSFEGDIAENVPYLNSRSISAFRYQDIVFQNEWFRHSSTIFVNPDLSNPSIIIGVNNTFDEDFLTFSNRFDHSIANIAKHQNDYYFLEYNSKSECRKKPFLSLVDNKVYENVLIDLYDQKLEMHLEIDVAKDLKNLILECMLSRRMKRKIGSSVEG